MVGSILTGMGAFHKAILFGAAICAGAFAVATARADEIRLKDGKKLYGVIVAYEDNMFKVKTDFGFVLVEKDKIASIVPSAPGSHPAAKSESPEAKKAPPPNPEPVPLSAPAKAASSEKPSTAAPVTTSKIPAPTNVSKPAKAELIEPAKLPATSASTTATSKPAAAAPSPKPSVEKKSAPASSAAPPPANASAANTAPANSNIPVVTAIPPPAPKPVEPPPNRETLQGNMYTNYTQGFRMYKPPSWKIIDDARKSLPNAIVAMGTSSESTLLIVGHEKSKDSLDVTAADVEKRLRDTYGNYRRISQRKTVAGGLPAVEIHYRGLADDHDWSGTLLVVSRGGDIFSVLGMTYADTDLIQIQENVIARAISSLEFSSN
jgi:hypothetical protein